MNQNKKSTSRQ